MQKQEVKLNKRERYKARLRPYDYFKEFETLDFENLGEGDRFYLQDFGIFNTDFLEDEFTMRLRIPAGRLSSEQFSYIAKIVKQYNLTVILTARGGIQLHELEYDNVFEIYKHFNELGLTTWQSFGDNIRNIVSDVYDGVGKYSEVEVYPLVIQMQEHILKNPRYVGMLPRRVSVGISGNRANVTSFFANDLYFALAQKDSMLGFNVYMGGKNTEVAQDADIFLLPDEVVDFFKAFVEAFYLHGSRSTRAKTRLFYLIEDIGMNGVKAHIQKEYDKEFQSAATLLLEIKEFSEHEVLKDGTYAFCYQTDFAKLQSDEMQKIAQYASEHDAEIRLGIDQNIYIIGLNDDKTPFASPKESSTVVACAGNLCPYSFWNIKNETSYLPLSQIHKHAIQVGFSGCAKGCGRHRHTDIGLIGLKTNSFGDTEGGARVFIGAEHSDGGCVARQLFTMVPLINLNEVLSLLITIFHKSGHHSFEDFSRHVLNKFSENFLAMWILANLQSSQALALDPNDTVALDAQESFQVEKALLHKHFSSLEFLKLIDDSFLNAITITCKTLWTVEGDDPNALLPKEKLQWEL
ncbi:MAG: nitrite/sulfite reductase [Campylobacterota bacterium]|nr:nitrite/sulfite reductase [Campylobacterota bacterium]